MRVVSKTRLPLSTYPAISRVGDTFHQSSGSLQRFCSCKTATVRHLLRHPRPPRLVPEMHSAYYLKTVADVHNCCHPRRLPRGLRLCHRRGLACFLRAPAAHDRRSHTSCTRTKPMNRRATRRITAGTDSRDLHRQSVLSRMRRSTLATTSSPRRAQHCELKGQPGQVRSSSWNFPSSRHKSTNLQRPSFPATARQTARRTGPAGGSGKHDVGSPREPEAHGQACWSGHLLPGACGTLGLEQLCHERVLTACGVCAGERVRHRGEPPHPRRLCGAQREGAVWRCDCVHRR